LPPFGCPWVNESNRPEAGARHQNVGRPDVTPKRSLSVADFFEVHALKLALAAFGSI